MDLKALHAFWFADAMENPASVGPAMRRWFSHDPAFDATIRGRFAPWLAKPRKTPEDPTDKMGLLLLLDQVPRNAFRGTPRAFAFDAEALGLARATLPRELAFHPLERIFLYLPFQHSERLADQDVSLEKFTALAELSGPFALGKEMAQRHHDTIARFKRFPHRNEILGRPSTAAEKEFLKDPKSWF